MSVIVGFNSTPYTIFAIYMAFYRVISNRYSDTPRQISPLMNYCTPYPNKCGCARLAHLHMTAQTLFVSVVCPGYDDTLQGPRALKNCGWPMSLFSPTPPPNKSKLTHMCSLTLQVAIMASAENTTWRGSKLLTGSESDRFARGVHPFD
jgi:hypothetical protein